jgi:GNAT superfamily N-acetyltransferase
MHDLDTATRATVDAYWAAFFGCRVARLRPARGAAVPHAELGDYAGVYAMTFGAAPVVSVPPLRLAAVRATVAGWGADAVHAPARVAALLGDRAGAVVGPALVTYADGRTLRPPGGGAGVRALTASDPEDVAALAALRAACPGPDWEHGGGALGPEPAVGAFAGGALAALATYEVWGGRLAHLAVVAHPAYRGRGHAAGAVRALADRALARGLVPQYRTLEANTPAVRLGAAAGFVPYATSLAVRSRAAGV